MSGEANHEKLDFRSDIQRLPLTNDGLAILTAAQAICDKIASLTASLDNIVEAICDEHPKMRPNKAALASA